MSSGHPRSSPEVAVKATVTNTLSHWEVYSCVSFLRRGTRRLLPRHYGKCHLTTASQFYKEGWSPHPLGHPGSVCRVGQLACSSERDEAMMLSILGGKDTKHAAMLKAKGQHLAPLPPLLSLACVFVTILVV